MDMAGILSIVCRRASGATLQASCRLHDHLTYAPGRRPQPSPLTERDRQHASVLIRAMLHAARVDPAFDRRNQDVLLRQLGDVLPQDRHRLRDVVAAPVDIASHASAVPIGLEQEVYAVSLLAIGDRVPAGRDYLNELANGLRLRPETCTRIHAEVMAAD